MPVTEVTEVTESVLNWTEKGIEKGVYRNRGSVTGNTGGSGVRRGCSVEAADRRAMAVDDALVWAYQVELVDRWVEPVTPADFEGNGAWQGLERALRQGAIIRGSLSVSGLWDVEADALALYAAVQRRDAKRIALVEASARQALPPVWQLAPLRAERCYHTGTRRVVVDELEGRRYCPVVWANGHGQIDAARRAYRAWWFALTEIVEDLAGRSPGAGGLATIDLLAPTLPLAPWLASQPKKETGGRPRLLTADQRAELVRLKAAGAPRRDMARRLGLTENQIRKQLQGLALSS